MNTLTFETQINAPAKKVWEILWDDASYGKWTAAFMEGSYAVSDWQEGSSIMFLSPGENGMYSVIEKKIPNKQMSFRHQGEVQKGEKVAKEWSSATENYYLEENGSGTTLKVVTDTVPEIEAYMKEAFPKALQKLKELCEQ